MGKSYAHPLLLLIKEENELEINRFAVIAGKNVGNAVRRNRVKRRIRACVDGLLPGMQSGWDMILQARQGAQDATFQQIQAALTGLLIRADILQSHE